MRFWWLGATALLASPAAAADCAALTAAKLPGVEITGATLVAKGAAPLKPAADICRVTLTARPSANSDVRIEVWIPQGPAWNGKFVQVGNGGFAGSIPYRSLNRIVADGYAGAGTDNGHQAEDGTDARWALGHPEKVIDFGWRAVKATTNAAKAVLAAYGTPPAKSYFYGCSDGGREALMTAQRYPADFDGIVAGAPANYWTRLMASAGLIGQAMTRPGRNLPLAKLPALQAASLKACGNGKGWVEDPRGCRFDPRVLACKGAETNQCLTPGQVRTVREVYAGRRDPATGQNLPGLLPGAEQAWGGWLIPDADSAKEQGFAPSYFANMVRGNAAFALKDLATADLAKSDRELGPILNSASPDLSAFRARGGKLIQYHGWNDPAISPRYSLAYAAALRAKLGVTDDFYRLFMVPGMLHCGGGASPTGVNWLAPLVAWVENGTAPATLTAAAKDGSTQSLNPQPLPPGGRAGSR